MYVLTVLILCIRFEIITSNRPAVRPLKENVVSVRRLSQINGDEPSDFTVATYNIWNIMFHWEVRKFHIADLIDTHDIDIIGLQEVRAYKDTQHNQLHDLQELLPKYKWSLFHPTRVINQNGVSRPPGWEVEGIGILSRHRILSYHAVNLSKTEGEDSTQRAVLSAQVSVEGEEISVAVTHFSYDRNSQCQNAWDVLGYLHNAKADKMIVLGDFNIYNNYQWPMKLLATGKVDPKSPNVCKLGKKPWFHGQPDYEFKDAWTDLHPRSNGYTFSNMPQPGFKSRPDRILLSKPGFKLDAVFTLGHGSDYKRDYQKNLYIARLNSIHNVARLQAEGKFFDSFCYWDCGPHGICRCGICVQKRNDECDEIFCSSCGPARLRYYQFLQAIFIILVSLSIFSLFILISKCVLLNARPRICAHLSRSVLGSKYFILTMIIGMFATYTFFKWSHADVLNLVSSQIPEELFPSDHLMVVARIAIE